VLAPGFVYFHGGGWVIGSLDTHENLCKALANRSGARVVSVDYRLAPEHPWPAAPEDCYAVVRHVAECGSQFGIDGARLAVGGDSAGGNLAAVVALMARDRKGPVLRHQVLLYPVVDHDFDRPSYRENADGYLLTRDAMRWFWQQYVADPARRSEGYASPQRAEKLEGLPSATVITAEFDPLRDEGEAYAERLRAAGVAVAATRYDGQIHGFASLLDLLDAGKRAVDQIGATLRIELA
jgi:acetyl esterase